MCERDAHELSMTCVSTSTSLIGKPLLEGSKALPFGRKTNKTNAFLLFGHRENESYLRTCVGLLLD
jgi:hypothetical protein